MSEDISVQILTQTSKNFQKLFQLCGSIDERVKSVKEQQENFGNKIDTIINDYNQVMQTLAVMESHDESSEISTLNSKIEETEKSLNEIEKRLTKVEGIAGSQQDRWKSVSWFILNVIFIIFTAWALTKLGLQAPAIP